MIEVELDDMEVGKWYFVEYHHHSGHVTKKKGQCISIEGGVPRLRVTPANPQEAAAWFMVNYINCTPMTCPVVYLDTLRNKPRNHVGPRIRAHLEADYQTRVRQGLDHLAEIQRGEPRHERRGSKRRRLMPRTTAFDTTLFRAPYPTPNQTNGGRRTRRTRRN